MTDPTIITASQQRRQQQKMKKTNKKKKGIQKLVKRCIAPLRFDKRQKQQQKQKQQQNLVEIRMFDRNLHDDYVVDLTSKEFFHDISVLDLSRNHIGDAGFIAIANELQQQQQQQQDTKKMQNLQRLLLNGNSTVGIAGMQHIGTVLPHCPNLRALNLSNCCLGNEECKALVKGFQGFCYNDDNNENKSNDNHYINNNKTNDNDMPPPVHLQELLLHSNLIGNQGAIALGGALKHNTNLKVLDLSDNSIGDEGIYGLVHEGLQFSQALTHVYIHDNHKYTNVGLQSLVHLVQYNSNITVVTTNQQCKYCHYNNNTADDDDDDDDNDNNNIDNVIETFHALTDQLKHYLQLNQCGRKYIQTNQPKFIPFVLSKAHSDPSVLYSLIRENPHVMFGG